MTEIVNTGERILLEKETPQMIARHLCAYTFASSYCAAKKVLDVGCGEGYGSSYLAQKAAQVTGMDYDKDIIAYARDKYRKANLAFCVGQPQDGLSPHQQFDVICSFQVIEHIRDTGVFLEGIKKLLRDKGRFICSTPNKLDASPHSLAPLNKFHVKEYLYGEFVELLQAHFKTVEMFGLKRGKRFNFFRRMKKIGICTMLPAPLNPVKKFYDHIGCDDFIIGKHPQNNALDFFAVCSV